MSQELGEAFRSPLENLQTPEKSHGQPDVSSSPRPAMTSQQSKGPAVISSWLLGTLS